MADQTVEPLRLKSYFSGTVEAAIELARREMGEDALLVNARPASIEARHLGAYEVVFGVPPRGGIPPPLPGVNVNQLAEDMAELRRQMERMTRAMAAQGPPNPVTSMRVPVARGLENVDETLGNRLSPGSRRGAIVPSREGGDSRTGVAMSGDAARTSASATSAYEATSSYELDEGVALAMGRGRALEDLFTTDATLGRIVMLVGPPGAGKTTTLVKLAARYGLGMGRRTQFITCDVFRVAAADQLRTLASILGVGCDVVETTVALGQAIEGHETKELILIDTPGIAHGEMEDAGELARFAQANTEIDVQLVLPASMKAGDLSRVVDDYMGFAPSKLLFTRLDETSRYGCLVNESARQGLPLSFLSAGQRVPDDLEPATRRRVAELVFDSGRPAKARSMTAGAGA